MRQCNAIRRCYQAQLFCFPLKSSGPKLIIWSKLIKRFSTSVWNDQVLTKGLWEVWKKAAEQKKLDWGTVTKLFGARISGDVSTSSRDPLLYRSRMLTTLYRCGLLWGAAGSDRGKRRRRNYYQLLATKLWESKKLADGQGWGVLNVFEAHSSERPSLSIE